MAAVLAGFLIALVLGFGGCGGGSRSAAPAQTTTAPEPEVTIEGQVGALAEEVLEGKWATGLSVALVQQDATRYLSYGAVSSTSDRRPDEHTVYELGEVTEVLTGVLLARMVEEGLVSLDQPITELLPQDVSIEPHEAGPPTLVQLATHHAGLPPHPDNLSSTEPGIPFSDYTPALLAEFLDRYGFPRAPGASYRHSPVGMGLLGNLLAARAQAAYEDTLRERVCAPLSMGDTRIIITVDMADRLATGHDAAGFAVSSWTMPGLEGAGALRSTAADLATFLRANLALMDTPLGPAMRMARKPRATKNDHDTQLGLGWQISADGSTHWQRGMTNGHSAFIALDGASRTGVVVLANTASPAATALGRALLSLLQRGEAELGLPEGPELPAEILDRYVGHYELATNVPVRVARDGQHLLSRAPDAPVRRLVPKSETEFWIRGSDATVRFAVGDDDGVQAMVIQQGDTETVIPRSQPDAPRGTTPPPAPNDAPDNGRR